MMKKITAILLTLSILLAFAACADKDAPDTEETTAENEAEYLPPEASTKQADALPGDGLDTGMKEKLSPIEYSAYMDLFYNKNEDAYKDKQFTKDGTFAVIRDQFSEVDRYYVWGYADKTKCCDYQWEIVMPEGAEIPVPGSYVKVKGTMTKDEAALDGFWLTDTELEVKEEFKDTGFDFDMTTMSSTLARVQIQNMIMAPEYFNGKTVRLFGRALSPTSIQHPYYNGAWSLEFTPGNKEPKTGEYLLVDGTFKGDKEAQKVETSEITLVD